MVFNFFHNLLHKSPVIISSFSTFSVENPFYTKTFLNIFQECSKKKAREPGRQAHARMIVSVFKPTVFASTCLLQMYIKCSRLECAVKVFDRMPERNCVSWTAMIFGYSINGKMGLAQSLFDLMPKRNVISWNSLLTGYLQNGNFLKSVEVFVMMGRDDVPYDETTFSVVLKACACLEDNGVGQQVHGVVAKLGFECEVVIGTAMLDMYAKCKNLIDARRVFNLLPNHDLQSYTALIVGYARGDHGFEGMQLFLELLKSDLGFNEVSLSAVFSACAVSKGLVVGTQIHGLAIKTPFHDNIFVANSILNMYGKCGALPEAFHIFDEMKSRNVVSWNAVIAACDQSEKALKYFSRMIEMRIKPDDVTYVIVLNTCSDVANVGLGKQIHAQIIKQKLQSHMRIINTLVDMYSKCGSIEDSVLMFQKSSNRDVVTCNTMVCAYAHHGYGNEALQVFEKMLLEKIMPNHATFVGVLHACAHIGLIDEAFHYLHVMQNDFGLVPELQHYSCMVDALGRCGRIIDALKLIEDMPLKADDVIWTSLLSNCKMQRNVKVAEIAARSLLQLDPNDYTAYVLLSDIYADAGMWREASEMRRIMQRRRLKKQPGCRWTN